MSNWVLSLWNGDAPHDLHCTRVPRHASMATRPCLSSIWRLRYRVDSSCSRTIKGEMRPAYVGFRRGFWSSSQIKAYLGEAQGVEHAAGLHVRAQHVVHGLPCVDVYRRSGRRMEQNEAGVQAAPNVTYHADGAATLHARGGRDEGGGEAKRGQEHGSGPHVKV